MGSKQVVLVDDDVDLVEIFAELIRSYGYDVVGFDDGRRAFTHLQRCRTRVGLVFLDLEMPGLNGFELLKLKEADPALAAIPVVVLTAWSGPLCLPPGSVARVLEKPTRSEVLMALVAAYCAPPGALSTD